MITAWRICKPKWARSAFDGRGAAEAPGRWNNFGTSNIYTAESRSLASLEVLVHAEDTSLLSAMSMVAIPISFAETLLETPTKFPTDWRDLPAPNSTRAFGDAWIASVRSAILRVPSGVTLGEFNYLLNPNHPDFSRIHLGQPEPFCFDGRLPL
jgi:RES domain-containing protein